jgi:hypothetical protein
MLCGDCHRWPGYPAVLSALDGPAQAMAHPAYRRQITPYDAE